MIPYRINIRTRFTNVIDSLQGGGGSCPLAVAAGLKDVYRVGSKLLHEIRLYQIVVLPKKKVTCPPVTLQYEKKDIDVKRKVVNPASATLE